MCAVSEFIPTSIRVGYYGSVCAVLDVDDLSGWQEWRLDLSANSNIPQQCSAMRRT